MLDMVQMITKLIIDNEYNSTERFIIKEMWKKKRKRYFTFKAVIKIIYVRQKENKSKELNSLYLIMN